MAARNRDGDHPDLNRSRKKLLVMAATVLVALSVLYVVAVYFNLIPQQEAANTFYIAVFGIIIVEIVANTIYQYCIRGITYAEAKTLSDLFRIIAYCVLLLILLTIIVGFQNLTGFLVGAGFLGIVIGLAAQNTLSNFISGVYLLASKTFEPNDNVIIHTWQYSLMPQTYPHDKFIPGFSGTIEAIGLLYTKLINDEGVPFYVPNSIVSQSLIINYRRAKEHRRRIQFDVSVKVPFKRIESIVDVVMRRNKKIIDDYDVDVDYLHDTVYVVTIHIKTPEMNIMDLKSELFKELMKVMPHR